MNFYRRKLYAFLHAPNSSSLWQEQIGSLACLRACLPELEQWWSRISQSGEIPIGQQIRDVGASSDRVNLHTNPRNSGDSIQVCHPISGQNQRITQPPEQVWEIPPEIQEDCDPERVFWWFWRFYPEHRRQHYSDALLFPAHEVLPDCPLHSHQATISALTGAMFPSDWQSEQPAQHPYLLLFSFSPVQEFIKSSRKFLDFWAGSYLLHYLSAKLCWKIAQDLGPDAIIVPSLWGQEIIDALMVQKYPDFQEFWKALNSDDLTPTERFNRRTSTSLSTAGFPNTMTVLVPGQEAAKKWGEDLSQQLKQEWCDIGRLVQTNIRKKVSCFAAGVLQDETKWQTFWQEFQTSLPSMVEVELLYRRELQQYAPQISNQHDKARDLYPNWTWDKLWDAQLGHTWEPYWTAVPLGYPGDHTLGIIEITKSFSDGGFDEEWIKRQQAIAQVSPDITLPAPAELAFEKLNVGTWWGSIQQRLRLTLQAVKHTRVWQIPAAPGERSTISGQFSAVHPCMNYGQFAEGGGLPEGSMRLFWFVMAKAYPGLFNGSERLNALELTKRMAWIYGDVAESLGIQVSQIKNRIQRLRNQEVGHQTRQFSIEAKEQLLYERFLRFPNLSSIAAARFLHDDHAHQRHQSQQYWDYLNERITSNQKRLLNRLTRVRASQLPKTDRQINPNRRKRGYYNGVMFSSKWLAEDMALDQEETRTLRGIVEGAGKACGFGEGSPADWWAIVLADGDGMGQYVSGEKLLAYEKYINQDRLEHSDQLSELFKTKKRMGPATHVGLNRALLDFSNRLVPYLTEQRFCGKVVYSGGDDVMAVLPLEDLPEYLLSLRSAWRGDADPMGEFATSTPSDPTAQRTGYWYPSDRVQGLPHRPLFTMGRKATMSMGIVIAHSSVPLPTVLESLWTAEADRAKKMSGKDGLCFRVIYSNGNQLEALMKGCLLQDWWTCIQNYQDYGDDLSPLLYRLAEELPQRASLTENDRLFAKAARVIMNRREDTKQLPNFNAIETWLNDWEAWAWRATERAKQEASADAHRLHKHLEEVYSPPIGADPDSLGKLLRFTAFWVDKRVERWKWAVGGDDNPTGSSGQTPEEAR